MTIEYILLLALFVLLVMGPLTKGPRNAFETAGPKLGARVERNLVTGTGWTQEDGKALQWEEK